MNFENIRLGLAILSESYVKEEDLKQINNSFSDLFSSLNLKLFRYSEVINCREESKKTGKFFKENGVDAILIYLATYSQDNLAIDIVYSSNCEIVLWGKEELLNYPVPDIAAYCGMTQIGGLLQKFDKKLVLIDGKISDLSNQEKLKKFLKVISIKKMLADSNLGLIGSRSDGMLENAFNELELRKQVGPEVINISLLSFFNDFNQIKESSINKAADYLFKGKDISRINKETISGSVRIYLALKEIISKYGISALAIRCWPELKENNICSPCFALSKLYDEGIATACEADVNALVTMLIGERLSSDASFLSDLLKIDDINNYAYYYHCGCASTKLCNNLLDIKYSEHPFDAVWKPGVIVEFPLKEGPVTFARMGERNGKFQIVAYTGRAVKTDMFVAGNVLLAVLDKKPSYVVEKLVEYGTEHHQITFYGNHLNELRKLTDFLGINYYEI